MVSWCFDLVSAEALGWLDFGRWFRYEVLDKNYHLILNIRFLYNPLNLKLCLGSPPGSMMFNFIGLGPPIGPKTRGCASAMSLDAHVMVPRGTSSLRIYQLSSSSSRSLTSISTIGKFPSSNVILLSVTLVIYLTIYHILTLFSGGVATCYVVKMSKR
ncbi:hypothetical protein RIF29_04927 [Crotalaria pallida]|uniref:Uncharacterized protein n=1 Tax=Crotalaria pallida TaxID=3830 RepID=A0AAN9P9H7_CROPI